MMQIVKTERSVQEEWRAIDGYHNYDVSSWGRVRKHSTGKLVRMCKGYGMRRVVLRYKDEFRLMVLAKLVLEAFVCKQPAGCKPYCLDGNYEHLYTENLKWVERRRKEYKYDRSKYYKHSKKQ